MAHVSTKLNVSIDVKASKIVAGLEGNKTCHFLQLFTVVATKAIESKGRKMKNGEGVEMSVALTKNNEAEDPINSDKENSVHNIVPENSTEKDSTLGLIERHEEVKSDEKKPDQHQPLDTHEGKLEVGEINSQFVTLKEDQIEPQRLDRSPLPDNQRGETSEKDGMKGNVTFTSSAFFKDSGNLDDSHDDGNDLLQGEVREESIAFKSARPQTARRRPPRLRVNKTLESARKYQTSSPVETVSKPFVFTDDNEGFPFDYTSGYNNAMTRKDGDATRR